MDVLYIPELGGADGDGVAGSRYRILRRAPEDGTVLLADRAVTRVEVATEGGPLRLVVPPETKGAARDFFVRLVITADEVPEVTFAAPTGETISFEDADDGVFRCEVGVNVFAFTETDAGIFIVNRKTVDIDFDVEFDPCGGTLDRTTQTFKLGAQYSNLPRPSMVGYSFLGWFTEAEGGVAVSEVDKCKTGVPRLYAHWEVYADPFVAAICEARNLTFFSEGDSPWFVDGGGAARSGAIGDSRSTSLTTTVQGRGTLSFRWRTSSEQGYDRLGIRLDRNEAASISGTRDWETVSLAVDADGPHTVEWRYSKDGSVSQGDDCGWVDDVAWTPAEG